MEGGGEYGRGRGGGGERGKWGKEDKKKVTLTQGQDRINVCLD